MIDQLTNKEQVPDFVWNQKDVMHFLAQDLQINDLKACLVSALYQFPVLNQKVLTELFNVSRDVLQKYATKELVDLGWIVPLQTRYSMGGQGRKPFFYQLNPGYHDHLKESLEKALRNAHLARQNALSRTDEIPSLEKMVPPEKKAPLKRILTIRQENPEVSGLYLRWNMVKTGRPSQRNSRIRPQIHVSQYQSGQGSSSKTKTLCHRNIWNVSDYELQRLQSEDNDQNLNSQPTTIHNILSQGRDLFSPSLPSQPPDLTLVCYSSPLRVRAHSTDRKVDFWLDQSPYFDDIESRDLLDLAYMRALWEMSHPCVFNWGFHEQVKDRI